MTAAIPGWTHTYSGKVRDLYVPDGPTIRRSGDVVLVVASDRVSAYDHVLSPGIPGKGVVLTQLSLWWFEQLADLVPNHVVSTDVPAEVAGRAMICRRLEMFPVECVARGYLTGSGLAEYRGLGVGHRDRAARRAGRRVAAARADLHAGDQGRAGGARRERAVRGRRRAGRRADARRRCATLTLAVYARAEGIARERGVILADTKLEFGTDPTTGAITLGDEVLTPDSSRFWPADLWQPGRAQPSFDKQFVRDWLTSRRVGLGPRGRRTAAGAARGRRRAHPGPLPRGVRATDRDRAVGVTFRSPRSAGRLVGAEVRLTSFVPDPNGSTPVRIVRLSAARPPPHGRRPHPHRVRRLADDAGSTAVGAGSADAPSPSRSTPTLGTAEIPAKPERVVTLGWGAADIAFSLGTTPVGIESDTWGGDADGYEPWFRDAVEKAGDELPTTIAMYPELDVDAVVALNPDLVLAPQSGLDQKTFDQLSAFVPVVAYPGDAWQTSIEDQVHHRREGARRAREGAAAARRAPGRHRRGRRGDTPSSPALTFAYVYGGDQPGALSVYLPGDPRVELLTGLGMTLAPSVSTLTASPGTFVATLGLENADQLDDAQMLFTWFNDADEQAADRGAAAVGADPRVRVRRLRADARPAAGHGRARWRRR